jgi:molybdopterin/thiamine biosynthesis adenylyltransferase
MSATPAPNPPGRIVLVGLGLIGSFLVSHLGRIPGLRHLTLVDRDVYDPSNLTCQDIAAGDVGEPKAIVQAQRLHGIRPELEVTPIVAPVESLPLGRLRADLVLTCLDSRAARQIVNDAVWRLGVPWIDAGVEASTSLARVTTYTPGSDHGCLECAWDDRDYRLLVQSYSCGDTEARGPATGASSGLGALAASLQARACERALSAAESGAETVSRQVVLEADRYHVYVTSPRRNRHCLRTDHSIWRIERLDGAPADITLDQALPLGGEELGRGPVRLGVAGSTFVRRLRCSSCGDERRYLRLRASIDGSAERCRHCGSRMRFGGYDELETLDASAVGPVHLGSPLS